MDDQVSSPAMWKHSSRSGGNGQCVEVADLLGGTCGVRDSKLGDASPVLAVTASQFAALLDDLKAGQL